MRRWIAALFFLLGLSPAQAQIVGALPFNLQNNTTADATQVMSNFNTIVSGTNANAAKNGVNIDITQLSGLTTALTRAQGGSQTFIATTASGGSANAQTVAATSPTFSLAAGVTVQFVPGFTNTGAATLNVASGTTLNVYRQTNVGPVPLAGGEIVAGSVTRVVYDGTQYQLLLDSASTVPPSAVFYTAGSAAPLGYVLLQGQALSRTTYAALYSILGTTYGVGDGVTTFNVPDARGRQFYSVDEGTGRISGCGSSGALASTCGSQTFVQANLPNLTLNVKAGAGNALGVVSGSSSTTVQTTGGTSIYQAANFDTLTLPLGGSGTAFSAPAIVLTAIMKY